jgi:hypothetical protein
MITEIILSGIAVVISLINIIRIIVIKKRLLKMLDDIK